MLPYPNDRTLADSLERLTVHRALPIGPVGPTTIISETLRALGEIRGMDFGPDSNPAWAEKAESESQEHPRPA